MALAQRAKQNLLLAVLLLLLLGATVFVYQPGLSGPFVFDDYPNFLQNDYVKLKKLNLRDLKQASFSLYAGPLQRPVAMASFALNYYFAGGFQNTRPFKITNLVIHLVNGLLIFWLSRLLLFRSQALSTEHIFNAYSTQQLSLFAIAITALWLLHPMQLTGVLYVVQRMASLSTLFVLFGLIAYLKARQHFLLQQRIIAGVWLVLCIGSAILGIYSKENAALLPVFILAIDLLLFGKERPWIYWQQLGKHSKRLLLSGLIFLLVILCIWALDYTNHGFGSRNFTQWERVLTESRVLIFYISLIIIPRIRDFGLYHDDIVLSTSLLSPPTTLASIAGLMLMLVVAFLWRKKHPLLSLGIVWFFIAHSMESTFYALELVHEHRNYLASYGIILIVIYLVSWCAARFRKRVFLLIIPALAILFAINTHIRSKQWADYYSLFYFSAMNHPKSPRAQSDFAVALHRVRQYRKAVAVMRYTASINPGEPGYYINMHISAFVGGIHLTPEEKQKTLELIKKNPRSVLLGNALFRVHSCVMGSCRGLAKSQEQWIHTLRQNRGENSLYDYMLGRALAAQGRYREAIKYLELSHKKDRKYLHPLFDLANIYIKLRQLKKADQVVARLKTLNKTVPYPRVRETALIEASINMLRNPSGKMRVLKKSNK